MEEGNDYKGKIVRTGLCLGKAIVDSCQILHELGLGINVVPVEQKGGEAGFLVVHFKKKTHVVNSGQKEGYDLRGKTGVGPKGSHVVVTSRGVMVCCSVVTYR
jgi:hypothetical protein